MNCQILNTLYIKANGEIPCDDDAGEQVNIEWIDPECDWSIEEHFNNKKYRHMRECFQRDVAPWPGICDHCAFLQRLDPFNNDLLHERRIAKIQIEPTLACGLRCACCSRMAQIKNRSGPHQMDVTVFEKILNSCNQHNYAVDMIEYCGQGEPLGHPEFSSFVQAARSIVPGARQCLVTNGNYDYTEVMREQVLDTIYISCDGCFQESYEKYRSGGDIETVFNFMRDAGKAGQQKTTAKRSSL